LPQAVVAVGGPQTRSRPGWGRPAGGEYM